LLAHKWQDVDLGNATVSVRRTLTRSGGRYTLGEPKTKKSRRSTRLTPRAANMLEQHLERQLSDIQMLGDNYADQGLVFSTNTGTPFNPSNMRQRSFTPLLRKANIPHIRFHDLRHTCATLLLGKGTHPKFVQELLGHATVAITLDTYSHVMLAWAIRPRAMQEVLALCRTPSPRSAALVSDMSYVPLTPASSRHVSPANIRLLEVGDAGFEPATSSL
jgi:integrase